MRGAYVATRAVTNSYLVRERDRRKVRELLLVVALTLPPVLGALGNIWLRGQVVRTGYEINQQEQQLVELERRQRQLELEWTTQSSPASVEARAAQLGLVEPSLDQVVRVEELQ